MASPGFPPDSRSFVDMEPAAFRRAAHRVADLVADYLERLAKEQGGASKGGGVFATHPGIAERAADAKSAISRNKWSRSEAPERDRRFQANVGKG